jgi:glycosyltransferase involved in cell wall biosynthesis
LRVAVVADFVEEGWPSMDLVADSLFERLRNEQADRVYPVLVRPSFKRRFMRVTRADTRGGFSRTLFNADRLLNRFVDYPRHLRRMRGDFDIFHITDHSYAHLVSDVDPARTVVTCHDLDAFRIVLEKGNAPGAKALVRTPLKMMATRGLRGLRSATIVACDSIATRDELLHYRLMSEDRTPVIANGVDSVFSARANSVADREAARMLGPAGADTLEILHVGSTIPRKRIDLLLRIFAAIRAARPTARLVRAGGAFTAEQAKLARELNVDSETVVLPFVNTAVLAAIYRRAAMVLITSEREGFGLPVIEALACGSPVIASDLAVLREVGGSVAHFVPVGDVAAWTSIALRLIRERTEDPVHCNDRRVEAIAQATKFSWSEYARRYVELYQRVAASAGNRSA